MYNISFLIKFQSDPLPQTLLKTKHYNKNQVNRKMEEISVIYIRGEGLIQKYFCKSVQKMSQNWVLVAYVYNPSYLGSRDQQDQV
jgi:hypothetical protein